MIIHGEASEFYHAQPFYGSGEIRAYLRSAQLCADMMAGICQRRTPALLFGIVSHTFFLEPDAFLDRVAIKPDKLHLGTVAGKAFEARAGDRIIISHDQFAALSRMFDRMPAEVRAIIASCSKEVTVRTEIDGVPVQCRPDLWDITGRRKYDLKSIDAIEKIDKAIWTHRYDVQDNVYSRVIDAEVGSMPCESSLIFVEKNPPFRWRIIDLDVDYQALANRDVAEALSGIRARIKSGAWGDEGALRDIASPPSWMENEIPYGAEEEEELVLP